MGVLLFGVLRVAEGRRVTRLILLLVLAACFVAPYLVTPSGAPDDHSAAGFGATRQALRGAPHGSSSRSDASVSQVAGNTGRPANGTGSLSVGSSPTIGGAPLAAARRLTGTATWCAPTPRYCHGWGGKAMLGAVRSFRYGDEPYTVQVTGFYGGKANAVLVTVVSYCACPRTAIDLSPHAFAQLAPLSVGRIRVVVDGIRSGPSPRAIPTAPATDLEGTE